MAFGGLQKGVKQMLIQELFSKGIMKMGPSPVDPQRQVGVFNPEAIAGLPALRTQEMEKFLWLVGEWNYENAVPPTPSSPAYGTSAPRNMRSRRTGTGFVVFLPMAGSLHKSHSTL